MTDENIGAPDPAPAAETPPTPPITQPAAPTPTTEFVRLVPAPPLPPRDLGVAYAMMLFTIIGVCGIQHFYLGKVGRGILWLLTLGIFGIGIVIDLFTLPSQTRAVNARRAVGIK